MTDTYEESCDTYEKHSDKDPVPRKRQYDDDVESTEKQTKTKRVYGKEPLLKVLVPNDAAGAIIGKGGANLGDLKSRYGASIRLSYNREFYPGTDERIVLLTGEISQIIDLNNYIIDKVHQNAAESSGKRGKDERRAQQIKIVMPNSTAGIIIGRNGATIKELQEETKAKIAIVGRDESSVRGERILTITGNTEQRIEAARQIISKIAADPENMANTTLKYSHGSSHQHDNYGGKEGGYMYNQNNDANVPQNSMPPAGPGGSYNAGGLGVLAKVAQQLVGGLSQSNTSTQNQNSIKTTVQIQMEIPEILVGPIVGPTGNNLLEFMQFSGAKIQFSHGNDFGHKTLTIHGDLNQTQIGYHLVNQKITQIRTELAATSLPRL